MEAAAEEEKGGGARKRGLLLRPADGAETEKKGKIPPLLSDFLFSGKKGREGTSRANNQN